MSTYKLHWPISLVDYAAVNVNIAPPPHGQGCYIYAFITFPTIP